MARDAGLEELLRERLEPQGGLTGCAMFGGWAWLMSGHLLCGARDDGVLLRLGRGQDGWALALPGVAPMLSRGRAMAGWVRVSPETFADDDLAERLVAAAVAFVRSLPPKP